MGACYDYFLTYLAQDLGIENPSTVYPFGHGLTLLPIDLSGSFSILLCMIQLCASNPLKDVSFINLHGGR